VQQTVSWAEDLQFVAKFDDSGPVLDHLAPQTVRHGSIFSEGVWAFSSARMTSAQLRPTTLSRWIARWNFREGATAKASILVRSFHC
jgi:hypothetical protein